MPKIIFKKMSLEDNINFVKWCYEQSDDLINIHTNTLNLFPELKNIPENISDFELNSLIKKVVTERYNNDEKLGQDIKRYSEDWAPYNDKFFDILSSYLNIKWPKEYDVIPVNVGIIPVCPRDVDKFSFSVFDSMPDQFLIETCAHELCHFLWFQKWKELYPDYNRDDFEAPSKIWEYSEMVVDPILNSKEFVSLFGKKTRYAYDSFYQKEGLMEGLFDVYSLGIPIEDKIVKGFEYLKDKEDLRKF